MRGLRPSFAPFTLGPPRREFWCQYAQASAAVKHLWELQSTAAERQALREMLATC